MRGTARVVGIAALDAACARCALAGRRQQALDLVARAAARRGPGEPGVESELFLVTAQADEAADRDVGGRSAPTGLRQTGSSNWTANAS